MIVWVINGVKVNGSEVQEHNGAAAVAVAEKLFTVLS